MSLTPRTLLRVRLGAEVCSVCTSRCCTAPVIHADGWNMIDSMIEPYNPEAYDGGGHGFCPFHAPTCNRTEGVASAALNGSTVDLGSEYETSLQVRRVPTESQV